MYHQWSRNYLYVRGTWVHQAFCGVRVAQCSVLLTIVCVLLSLRMFSFVTLLVDVLLNRCVVFYFPLSTLIGFRVDTWGVVFFWNWLLLAHPCIKFIKLLCHVPNKNNATNILPYLFSHVVFHSGNSSGKQPLSTLCVYFKWRHYSALLFLLLIYL